MSVRCLSAAAYRRFFNSKCATLRSRPLPRHGGRRGAGWRDLPSTNKSNSMCRAADVVWRWARGACFQLFNIGRHVNRFHLAEVAGSFPAPSGERTGCDQIGCHRYFYCGQDGQDFGEALLNALVREKERKRLGARCERCVGRQVGGYRHRNERGFHGVSAFGGSCFKKTWSAARIASSGSSTFRRTMASSRRSSLSAESSRPRYIILGGNRLGLFMR